MFINTRTRSSLIPHVCVRIKVPTYLTNCLTSARYSSWSSLAIGGLALMIACTQEVFKMSRNGAWQILPFSILFLPPSSSFLKLLTFPSRHLSFLPLSSVAPFSDSFSDTAPQICEFQNPTFSFVPTLKRAVCRPWLKVSTTLFW